MPARRPHHRSRIPRALGAAAAALLALAALAGTGARDRALADPAGCQRFATQTAAQAHYGPDPAGHPGLDADRDGLACEGLPCPCDAAATPPSLPSSVTAPGPVPLAELAASLPTPEELPAGFAPEPALDRDVSAASFAQVERGYIAAGDGGAARLLVGLTATATTATLEAALTATLRVWEDDGYRFEPVEGLGDGARVGVSLVDRADPPQHGIVVFAWAGARAVGVHWQRPGEPPPAERALELAAALLARLRPADDATR